MERVRCANCGNTNGLKRGWTNEWFCSYRCEIQKVSSLHDSMPNTGRLPYRNWVPYHVGDEITRRWEGQP
jgi:hypothetical protein